MTRIATPDSVTAYFTDKAIRTAVDDLVGQLDGKHMPVDDWDEQRDYHRALLMAAKVRADYAEFLFEVIDALFKPKQTSLPFSSGKMTSNAIWDDKQLSCGFTNLNGEDLGIGMIIRNEWSAPFASQQEHDPHGWPPVGFCKLTHGWSNNTPGQSWPDYSYGRPIHTKEYLGDPSRYVTEWSEGFEQIIEAFRNWQK